MNYNKKETAHKIKFLVSKPQKYKHKIYIWLFRFVLFSIICATAYGIGTGVQIVKSILHDTPKITPKDVQPTGFSSIIYDDNESVIQKLSDYESNREEVSLSDIPKDLQNAFIAIEDSRFYEHKGIDLRGIFRAGMHAISSHELSQGASTITQQLLKNNVFQAGGEKNFKKKLKRKVQEQYLAIQLEKKMSKKEILEAYLNTINLGEGTLGVQAASETYFDKPVAKLTLSECGVIAAITQNPTQYNPITNPDSNAKRRLTTLNYMLDAHMITKKAYEQAINDDVYSRIQKIHKRNETTSHSYSYFVDALIHSVVKDLEDKLNYNETQAYNALYSGGLKIYSTQNKDLQKICDSEINNRSIYENAGFSVSYALSYQLSVINNKQETQNYSEKDIARFLGQTNTDLLSFPTKKAANRTIAKFKKTVLNKSDQILGENKTLTIQPQISFSLLQQSSGYVKALVGGRGQKSGNLTLNRATDTTKQPGSTFKVVSTFVPALDTAGITLGSVYDDCPYNYENSSKPVNNYYTNGFRGLSSVRDAIRDSMNIVTAKCMADITPQVGYDYLKNLGFTTLVEKKTGKNDTVYSDIQQSLCLGGITNGVTNLELTASYAAIANKGGYHKPVLYTKIVDHDGTVLIDNTNESTQVMKESTAWLITNAMKDVVSKGTGTQAQLAGNMAVAGKTGTTSNNYDHWFVGYTPYYTAGIWCGYDANRSFLSGGVEKKIWANIMNSIITTQQETIKDFDPCDGIVAVKICHKCGKLPIRGVCSKDPRGSMVQTEYYAAGTEPTEKCDCHTKLTICTDSSLPASELCPPASLKTVIYQIRPKNSTGVTDDTPYELPADFSDHVCNIHSKDASQTNPSNSQAPAEASTQASQ